LLDLEARQLLNKFQYDEPAPEQTVSNVLSDNMSLKEQLKETVQDLNRLDDYNSSLEKTISELKAKIETMKKR